MGCNQSKSLECPKCSYTLAGKREFMTQVSRPYLKKISQIIKKFRKVEPRYFLLCLCYPNQTETMNKSKRTCYIKWLIDFGKAFDKRH